MEFDSKIRDIIGTLTTYLVPPLPTGFSVRLYHGSRRIPVFCSAVVCKIRPVVVIPLPPYNIQLNPELQDPPSIPESLTKLVLALFLLKTQP